MMKNLTLAKTHWWKFLLLLAAAVLAACSLSTPQPTATLVKTQIPEASPVRATSTPETEIVLSSIPVETSGKSPDYTLKTDTPVLESNHPYREEFNRKTDEFVKQRVAAFMENLADWTPMPGMMESSFFLSFTTIPYDNRFASIQFWEEFYMAGAAHPSHQIFSLVYDLQEGREVALDQLFLPGVDYLATISAYCKAELSKREIGFDMQPSGADPTAVNYSVWNISADGLVITFNEYQVAGYAAGAQTVVIPYIELKEIIDPQGPLGSVVK